MYICDWRVDDDLEAYKLHMKVAARQACVRGAAVTSMACTVPSRNNEQHLSISSTAYD